MRGREDHVAHRLSSVLYEAWSPDQVRAVAVLACEAVDEWNRARLHNALAQLGVRRDMTVSENAAYRAGVEDVEEIIGQWERNWETE